MVKRIGVRTNARNAKKPKKLFWAPKPASLGLGLLKLVFGCTLAPKKSSQAVHVRAEGPASSGEGQG